MTNTSLQKNVQSLLIANPVALSLAMAPFDDEPDDDDFDGGLSEARREADEGRLLSHDEIKRELGLP